MKKKIILPLSILAIIVVSITLVIFYKVNNSKMIIPEKIVVGENICNLRNYKFEKDALEPIKEIINKSENMLGKYTITYLDAKINNNGTIKSFNLTLDIFNENNDYFGYAEYTYDNKKLTYNPPKENHTELVIKYNENSSIDYLSEQLKKIPLKKQIKVNGLDNNYILYQPNTILENDTPVFDGSDGSAFPVLSKDDYNAGKGGKSNGKSNVVIRLYDGMSIAVGQQYLYVCKPQNPEKAVGNPEAMMQCDYFLDNGKIKFTRNYGADWINVNIPEDDINETLEFNRNWLELPPTSVFISSDEKLPIAFFYGEDPKIKMSSDNGQTWYDVVLPNLYYGDKPKPEDYDEYCKPITRRVIGFNTPQFGYAALGTDWTMGSGECKACYFTLDGGKTWERKELPLQCSSNVLFDMAMANEKVGVVALDSRMEVDFPLLYVTNNMGDSWTEITYPFKELPQEIQYLSDIESFSFENGVYTLVLGQSNFGTIKATFTAKDLNGPWDFIGYKKTTIHTVG